MYTVSFRIPIAPVLGTTVYINGSCQSTSPLPRGHSIKLFGGFQANVIESVITKRDPNTYKWHLLA